MNTEQNYHAGDSHAREIPYVAPTGEISPFFTAVSDAEKTIQMHYRDLHKIVYEFKHLGGLANPIENIKDLWLLSLPDCEESAEAFTITINKSFLDKTYDTMELMVFIAKMGEKWAKIEQLEDRHNYNKNRA